MILHKYTTLLPKYFIDMYPIKKMMGKKLRQYCKNSIKMFMIQF